ncbi:MAG: hypothetical protein AAGU27_09385 [Dehalobacterium sp.]
MDNTKKSADEAFAIHSTLTDIELASFPCAYSTAENMICRVGVKEGDIELDVRTLYLKDLSFVNFPKLHKTKA